MGIGMDEIRKRIKEIRLKLNLLEETRVNMKQKQVSDLEDWRELNREILDICKDMDHLEGLCRNDVGLITRELTQEQVRWLEVMDNFKNRTVKQLLEDIQIGGFLERSAHEKLQILGEVYGPEEED